MTARANTEAQARTCTGGGIGAEELERYTARCGVAKGGAGTVSKLRVIIVTEGDADPWRRQRGGLRVGVAKLEEGAREGEAGACKPGRGLQPHKGNASSA